MLRYSMLYTIFGNFLDIPTTEVEPGFEPHLTFYLFVIQLEMTELNLQQLRSASNDNATAIECNQTTEIGKESHTTNHNIVKEDLIYLKKENDTQRARIEELTLYIQQATEG